MLDLIIKLLLILGIQFGYTETGQISLSEADHSKLVSSSEYKDNGSPPTDGIVVVPEVDPEEREIVVIPEVDPIVK